MDSIDKLLAEIKTEYTEPKTTATQVNLPPIDVVYPTTKSDVLIDKLFYVHENLFFVRNNFISV